MIRTETSWMLGGSVALADRPAVRVATVTGCWGPGWTVVVALLPGALVFDVIVGTGQPLREVTPDWPTGIALGLGGLVGAYVGARIQGRLPDVLIRRMMGVLVVAIGARYLWLGLS